MEFTVSFTQKHAHTVFAINNHDHPGVHMFFFTLVPRECILQVKFVSIACYRMKKTKANTKNIYTNLHTIYVQLGCKLI